MAESIASLLVQQLQNLLVESSKVLEGLREELQYIKDEFERMTAFLRVADSVEDKDPEIAVWVKQVRQVAYDTEDVLDEYELLFSAHGGRGLVWRIYTFVKTLRARYRLASEIQRIKNRVRDISEGHRRYSGRYEIPDQASRSGVSDHTEFDGRGAALLQDETDLVGIDKPKDELSTLLLDGDTKLKVVSVVGMGELGKTTLVKKVYEGGDVRSQFQSHAWLTVSKSFNVKELLKNLIEQLYREIKERVPEEVQTMDHNALKEFIRDFLSQRKSIIVFDDVWDVNSWKDIEYALPKSSSNCRVMLTTRVMDVALASCTNSSDNLSLYEVKPLSPEDSWTLFCNKAFKGSNCPPHLKDISEKILKKCECLPLAIVAIGGILALKYQRLEDWEMVYRRLGVELEGEGKLERLKRILCLSFYDLPYHLKNCLLYLSIFPEDYRIGYKNAIRSWAAEGFVQEKEGLTREEVGKHYLNELVNRSLLQVAGTDFDGTSKSCRVHDILREIILSKSREQNFTTVVDENSSKPPKEVRRLAIHGLAESTTKTSNKFRHLRSLFLFSHEFPLLESFISSVCGGSRLLQVLDLSGAPLKMIPDEVFKLFHLRCLYLRDTNVRTIPKSIGKLQNLETLDLYQTFVTELPVQILNLRRLRHLIVGRVTDLDIYQPFVTELPVPIRRLRRLGHLIVGRMTDLGLYDSIESFSAPYKIGSLNSLQTLRFIEAGERDGVKIVTEIGNLTQLRSLGITKLRKEDGKDLCFSLERLTNLRKLRLVSIEEDEIIDLQHTLRAIPYLLRKLILTGRLEKVPQWIPSLQGLTTCYLQRSRLKNEPLLYLEDSLNLIHLALFDAYEGEQLHFKAGKFQPLKSLEFTRLKELRWVTVEKSSMPCLEELWIADSKLMEELPSGIEHLSKLEHLYLFNMAEKLITSLQNQENRSTQAVIHVGDIEKLEDACILG